jgi:hypothetical protein
VCVCVPPVVQVIVMLLQSFVESLTIILPFYPVRFSLTYTHRHILHTDTHTIYRRASAIGPLQVSLALSRETCRPVLPCLPCPRPTPCSPHPYPLTCLISFCDVVGGYDGACGEGGPGGHRCHVCTDVLPPALGREVRTTPLLAIQKTS